MTLCASQVCDSCVMSAAHVATCVRQPEPKAHLECEQDTVPGTSCVMQRQTSKPTNVEQNTSTTRLARSQVAGFVTHRNTPLAATASAALPPPLRQPRTAATNTSRPLCPTTSACLTQQHTYTSHHNPQSTPAAARMQHATQLLLAPCACACPPRPSTRCTCKQRCRPSRLRATGTPPMLCACARRAPLSRAAAPCG